MGLKSATWLATHSFFLLYFHHLLRSLHVLNFKLKRDLRTLREDLKLPQACPRFVLGMSCLHRRSFIHRRLGAWRMSKLAARRCSLLRTLKPQGLTSSLPAPRRYLEDQQARSRPELEDLKTLESLNASESSFTTPQGLESPKLSAFKSRAAQAQGSSAQVST
ncbi:hypothetical protein C8F04DRAFT_1189091 [Mycena alexandri]|uniref:Uncharacterized protein n=1 Tax=Mycena alexandri TaxID=1745969 RepID=A0AAD6SIZ0_9AGAR|nr:hypothetical protein C8F04DRAFT_1189091 [Mycena alexandri]